MVAVERRQESRRVTDFFAIERRGESRYYRLVLNVSGSGLLFEDRIADERPGQILELELPRGMDQFVRVRAEVKHVHAEGQVGVRLLDGTDAAALGGIIDL